MIANFYFDSDTLIHLGNGNGLIYLLDTRASYQGFWKYPDGIIFEINGKNRNSMRAMDLLCSQVDR